MNEEKVLVFFFPDKWKLLHGLTNPTSAGQHSDL